MTEKGCKNTMKNVVILIALLALVILTFHFKSVQDQAAPVGFYNGTTDEQYTITDLGSKKITDGFKYVFDKEGNLVIEKERDFTTNAGIEIFNIPERYILTGGVTCTDVRLSDSESYLEMTLELGESSSGKEFRGIRGKSPTLYLNKDDYATYQAYKGGDLFCI